MRSVPSIAHAPYTGHFVREHLVIFALTTILENRERDVISATNGRQAIELLQTTPEISVVLVDIMMPEMDGYETMREIRKETRFRRCRSWRSPPRR